MVRLCSPQHQGRLSLDLSQQKQSNDYSESSSSRSSRASHGTNSLSSSARLGQSLTHAHTNIRRLKDPMWLCILEYCIKEFIPGPHLSTGSSSNVQYRAERIKIPSTPRYLRSMLGSDRGNVFIVKTETKQQDSSNKQIHTDFFMLFFHCRALWSGASGDMK